MKVESFRPLSGIMILHALIISIIALVVAFGFRPLSGIMILHIE